ncbi:MAG TPA: tRNA pseudouridine(55) synthase TruB [Firmicutes bacterium]|uniref:tRNA pseudouridine synthase B n=1 Tax=Capillibacterium thermochitinicola TaxID=2699427 RepID=A0A8J6HYE4_9FIRM|nr:tRNA pseudouridine(55) synthase TruB [Capillibacterium thermochitinicola]MBA2133842.1 tRNA pseudouridine(55) synthase TruB [Capillibacterium thermochitinicola]HHW11637.1 tRNA pseudouridine(55) synthase TruB [Bacillota bacterium]
MTNNGFLVINKPSGYTSHQVVAQARRILAERRIGHTGTLDPMATGVLVLAIGKATKLISFLDEERKMYRARLVLGLSTDTQDLTGRELSVQPETEVSREKLLAALAFFTGEQEQTPPMYSAVKINGEPLYKLARAGKEINRAKRKITIYRLEVAEPLLPVYGFKEGPVLLIECSRGTYIRTLCHDLGAHLGVGGCMGDLVRLASGPFRLAEALTLDELAQVVNAGKLREYLIPPSAALSHLPMVRLNETNAGQIRNGGRLFPRDLTEIPPPEACLDRGLVQAVDVDGSLLAVLKYHQGPPAFWQPVRVLT